MRAPFRASAEALIAAGYKRRRDHYAEAPPVVFGGEVLIVNYSAGGRYSDNGGSHYSAADVNVRPRFDDKVHELVYRKAKDAHPELFAAVQVVPRSDRQARAILERAAELDAAAAAYLPEARAEVAAEEARRAEVARQSAIRQKVGGLTPELLEEVMRLHAEGLLEGSNALAGLKAIADQIHAIRTGADAAADQTA